MSGYQIVLADDHAMFRQGIKRILEKDKGLEIIGEAGDGIQLLELLKRVTPEIGHSRRLHAEAAWARSNSRN